MSSAAWSTPPLLNIEVGASRGPPPTPCWLSVTRALGDLLHSSLDIPVQLVCTEIKYLSFLIESFIIIYIWKDD